MDMEALKTLLPEAGEETLSAVFSAHTADLEAAAQRTAALEQQLSALTLDRAVDRAMAGTEFSSKAARDFIRGRLTAAGLPVENGALTGAAELIEQLRKEDPGAFLQDRPKVQVTVAAKPVASGGGLPPFAWGYLKI